MSRIRIQHRLAHSRFNAFSTHSPRLNIGHRRISFGRHSHCGVGKASERQYECNWLHDVTFITESMSEQRLSTIHRAEVHQSKFQYKWSIVTFMLENQHLLWSAEHYGFVLVANFISSPFPSGINQIAEMDLFTRNTSYCEFLCLQPKWITLVEPWSEFRKCQNTRHLQYTINHMIRN